MLCKWLCVDSLILLCSSAHAASLCPPPSVCAQVYFISNMQSIALLAMFFFFFNLLFHPKSVHTRHSLQVRWWIRSFPWCNTKQSLYNLSQRPTCHSPFVTIKSSVLILHFSSSQPDWETSWQQVSHSVRRQRKKINILKERVTLLHLEPVSYSMKESVLCAICLTWLPDEFAWR